MDKSWSDWLMEKLNEKNWSQADLARAAGRSRAVISKYVVGNFKNPEPAVLVDIAKALKLPPEDIFRKAGVLPSQKNGSPTIEEANYLLQQLSEEDQRHITDYIRYVAERRTNYVVPDLKKSVEKTD